MGVCESSNIENNKTKRNFDSISTSGDYSTAANSRKETKKGNPIKTKNGYILPENLAKRENIHKYYNITQKILEFEGEYLNGEKNGKCKEYDYEKLKFEGEYLNGEKNGKCKEYNYDGNWLKNKREGFGRYYYSNGDIEEGEYKQSKKFGKHKKYIANYDIKEVKY